MLITILVGITVLIIFQLFIFTLCVALIRDMATLGKEVASTKTFIQIGSAAALRSDKVSGEIFAHMKAIDILDAASLGTFGFNNPSGTETHPFVRDVYRSQDGKHSAGSLPELLEKMKNDPDYYPKHSKSSEYDILKDAFNDIVDDEEEWKKPKKDDEDAGE